VRECWPDTKYHVWIYRLKIDMMIVIMVGHTGIIQFYAFLQAR